MTDPTTDPTTGPDPELSGADARMLAAARDAYMAEPAPAPAGLVDKAMRTVSVDLLPAQRLPLPGGGFVTDTAAANALRLVLDGGFGGPSAAVVARRCRVEPDAGGWRVGLTVAVSFAHYDRHGDSAIRARVVEAAAELFGAVVARVDIDVVDVFVERPTRGAS